MITIVIIMAIIIALLLTYFLFSGIKQVPQQERWIIEIFGKYYRTLDPGIHWIFPLAKPRARISVWEQRYPLFTGDKVKIDFKNGSAVPRDAYAFVQCNIEKDKDAPYKMVYTIKNIKEATISLIESALRSYLNGIDVKEGLELGRAGYDLFARDKIPRSEANKVRSTMRKWGLKLNGVTIGDFSLDEKIISAREEVLKAQRLADAAKSTVKQKVLESAGLHGEIKTMLIEKYNYSSEKAEKIALDYVKFFKGVESGQLKIIEWMDENNRIYPEIAKIVTAINTAKTELTENKKRGDN